MALMLRLGIWQLDRFEQRQAFNNHYFEQIEKPPYELSSETLDQDLETMAYREITVSGRYDHSNEVAIRNQSWENQPGVHLLTPLIISGSNHAVLVDRGWIPLDVYQSGNWQDFSETDPVIVNGIIRLSQTQPTLGGRPDPTPKPGETIKAWNFVDTETISTQIPYPLITIYIQQSPDLNRDRLPYPSLPEIEITDGPHLSYAIQWFAFTVILGGGYLILLHRENQHKEKTTSQNFMGESP
jgi:surfeit locus 1 family protein